MSLETKADLRLGFLPYVQGTPPAHLHSPYVSSKKRASFQPLISIPQTLSERTGPQTPRSIPFSGGSDMTRGSGSGEALGQRITVSGRVLDENGRPQPEMLIELWQANAAGRYLRN